MRIFAASFVLSLAPVTAGIVSPVFAEEPGSALIADIVGKHRTPEERAEKLFQAATAAEDPALRIALFSAAVDHASKGATVEARTVAEKALTRLYDLAPARQAEWADKQVELYRRYFRLARTVSDKQQAGTKLIQALEVLGENREAQDRWSDAASAYREAMQMARHLGLGKTDALTGKYRRATHLESISKQVAGYARLLENDPTRSAVRLLLILALVVELDQPARAVPYLNQDVDEMLRTYVPLATGKISDAAPAACIELARWYRGLAGNASSTAKPTMLLRSIAYFQQYLQTQKSGDAKLVAIRLELSAVQEEWDKIAGVILPEILRKQAVLILTFDRETIRKQGDQAAAMDLSPAANHGQIFGAVSVPGKSGEALRFDGGDDYVLLGNPRSLQITGDQTVAMWLLPEKLDARRNPFAKAWGGEGTLTLEPTGILNYYFGSGGGNSTPYQEFPSGKLTAGKWTHVTIVRDMQKKSVVSYINGQKTSEIPFTLSAKASLLPAYVGKGYVEPFLGLIDEVAVFASALSEEDVKLLFDLGDKGKSLH